MFAHSFPVFLTSKLLTSKVHNKFAHLPNVDAFAALACAFQTFVAFPFTLYDKIAGGVARIILPHLHFYGSCTTIIAHNRPAQKLVPGLVKTS